MMSAPRTSLQSALALCAGQIDALQNTPAAATRYFDRDNPRDLGELLELLALVAEYGDALIFEIARLAGAATARNRAHENVVSKAIDGFLTFDIQSRIEAIERDRADEAFGKRKRFVMGGRL